MSHRYSPRRCYAHLESCTLLQGKVAKRDFCRICYFLIFQFLPHNMATAININWIFKKSPCWKTNNVAGWLIQPDLPGLSFFVKTENSASHTLSLSLPTPSPSPSLSSLLCVGMVTLIFVSILGGMMAHVTIPQRMLCFHLNCLSEKQLHCKETLNLVFLLLGFWEGSGGWQRREEVLSAGHTWPEASLPPVCPWNPVGRAPC